MAHTKTNFLIILPIGVLPCLVLYLLIYVVTRSSELSSVSDTLPKKQDDGCCRGIEGFELQGHVVNKGSPMKFDSSSECCNACKSTCNGDNGPCLCDSWVYCGDQESCAAKFGQCWLKKQRYWFDPDWQETDENKIWTSGFVFGNVEAIMKLETKYGTIRIKLRPECDPHSFLYILKLTSGHCIGCKFYRAEDRAKSWDSKGNHLDLASFGPPFGLIQGTLEAEGVAFKKISSEEHSVIERGSVAWIGSGPEFFISLANHHEWQKEYTVFGYVVPEDMEIVEKIARLPTIPDVWNNTSVLGLEEPVSFWFERATK